LLEYYETTQLWGHVECEVLSDGDVSAEFDDMRQTKRKRQQLGGTRSGRRLSKGKKEFCVEFFTFDELDTPMR